MSLCKCLVGCSNLQMLFAEEVDVSVERLEEAVNSSLVALCVLVHETESYEDSADLRVVVGENI